MEHASTPREITHLENISESSHNDTNLLPIDVHLRGGGHQRQRTGVVVLCEHMRREFGVIATRRLGVGVDALVAAVGGRRGWLAATDEIGQIGRLHGGGVLLMLVMVVSLMMSRQRTYWNKNSIV